MNDDQKSAFTLLETMNANIGEFDEHRQELEQILAAKLRGAYRHL